MNILIAIDSMKGSLTSGSRKSGRRRDPHGVAGMRRSGSVPWLTEGKHCGSADRGYGGERVRATVTGPLGEPVTCEYGILEGERPENPGAGRIAVMEMAGGRRPHAGAPGAQESPVHYDPGGGRDDPGCRGERMQGICGGNRRQRDQRRRNRDVAGPGLGFPDEREPGSRRGGGAERAAQNRMGPGSSGIGPVPVSGGLRCEKSTVRIRRGQRQVFGPQKGASPDLAREMDGWMGRYADLARSAVPEADPSSEGSGAAGGLGFAFRTFLKADLEPGAKIVLEKTGSRAGLRMRMWWSPARGGWDGQTAMGKGPGIVASLAKRYGKPVVALAGSIAKDADRCREGGSMPFFPS